MRTRWNAVRTVVVWAAATIAGIAVCWWGVRPVLDAAVPDRKVAFPSTLGKSPESVAPPPAPSTSRPAHSAGPHPTPTRSPSRSILPSLGTSTSGPTASPQVVDGWTLFSDGTYTRTFQMQGGTATVKAGQGTMTLMSATPKPGFVMAVTPTADDRVVVNFTGLNLHISTLEAKWNGSAPTANVTEVL
jgi:hypothetical protein